MPWATSPVPTPFLWGPGLYLSSVQGCLSLSQLCVGVVVFKAPLLFACLWIPLISWCSGLTWTCSITWVLPGHSLQPTLLPGWGGGMSSGCDALPCCTQERPLAPQGAAGPLQCPTRYCLKVGLYLCLILKADYLLNTPDRDFFFQ